MLKIKLFGMMTFIAGILLVFSLFGCDNGGTSGNGNGNENGNDKGVIDDNLILPDNYAWIIGTSPNCSGIIFNANGTFLNVIETPPSFQTLTGGTWSVSGNEFTDTPHTDNQLARKPYSVSGTTFILGAGTGVEAAYTKTNIGISSNDGFNVTGYSGSGSQILYASANAGINDLATLMTNQSGYGVISSSGKVTWAEPATGPSGTYTLYIVSGSSLLKKTSSPVEITNGNGTIAYTAFVDI